MPKLCSRLAVAGVLAVAVGCSGSSSSQPSGQGGSGSTGSGGSDTGTGGTNTGTGGTGSGTGTGGKNTGTGGAAPGTGGSSTGRGGSTTTGGGGTGNTSGFDGSGATVNGFFIPNSHPRLFWTADRLAKAKVWWKSNSFTPRSDQYSANDQLFAYMMTGNNTYCQEAISNAMMVDLSGCTADKNGCDEARYNGETAILTYDWCFSVLSDTQKSTLLANWNKWLAAIQKQSWGGVPQSQSNYYWGNLRNEAEWGIASYFESQSTATAFLNDALVTRYANDFVAASKAANKGLGGLALEGGQYGPYQGYYAGAIVFPSIVSGGRDIFDETPYWKGTVLNRIYATPPQKTTSAMRSGWDVFAFGDDEMWENGSPAQDTNKGTFMKMAANQWAQSNIGMWARTWLATVTPDMEAAAASTDAGGSMQDFTNLPLDYYDAGPRYLFGRSDWTVNATSYFFQMGDLYSTGHNHNDWGAFQINRKGRWLSRETVGYSVNVPGYGGTGTQPISGGYAHNVPLVNGQPGETVQGFPGEGGDNYWMGPPIVHRLESQPGYAYADVDLTPVYHLSNLKDGNAAAQHVERELWFFRDIETFVILDRLGTDTAARSRTFLVHCETNPMLVDATHIRCVNGTQQLAVTTLLPAAPSSRTVVNEATVSGPAPAANVQYRVEINDAPNATLSYTLHVLQAMDTSGTLLAPKVVDSASGTPASGTLTVTLDATHSLTINKGMTSSGGSIVVNGANATLRADAEPFGLDANDFPVWGP
jgi:hypothetical protein